MLHSGSRGVGNRIGTYFIELAKKDMQVHEIHLEDKDLSYLSEGTKHFEDYCEAVSWAQDYARLNRKVMLDTILCEVLPKFFPDMWWDFNAVNCHHNYIEKEHHFGKDLWITRKGAVRAQEGDLGIIPGSMGKKSFIVRGRGNAKSLNSCSHGAGRTMSRSAAKKIFTVEDVVEQTAGVECRKDAGVIDEIPSAYKDIDAVINVQVEHNMIEVLHELKQILCVKG
jgi:tRNA-splicing ligase RtcB